MSINRNQLIRGPAYISYGGANFFTRSDMKLSPAPVWSPVMTSMAGEFDQSKRDLVLTLDAELWPGYGSLPVLFPSYLLDAIPGTSIFGTADVALTIICRNNDVFTLTNAQITKMSNLFLGVDNELFATATQWLGLLGNNDVPETAGGYLTAVNTPGAYSDATANFSPANFSKSRTTGAWNASPGFGAIVPQKGVSIEWEAKVAPVPCDGLGTVDYSVNSAMVRAKAIPIGPSIAQLLAAINIAAAHGTAASALSADLVWTAAAGAPAITVKNAYLKAIGYEYSQNNLRNGECLWESTRKFAAGVISPIAVVA